MKFGAYVQIFHFLTDFKENLFSGSAYGVLKQHMQR